MNKLKLSLLALTFSCWQAKAQYSAAQELQAKKIVAQMTLAEKIGQMTQLTLDVVLKNGTSGTYPPVIDSDKLNDVLINSHVGSIFNITADKPISLQQWTVITNTMQELISAKSRMKIPLLYAIDAMHGNNTDVNATIFPHAINQAATFNPALIKSVAAAQATEIRAAGISWAFAPVLDLGVDVRWSRFYETFGEDPLLASKMGEAVTKGFQGSEIPLTQQHVLACLKHFLGYSAPKSGKDRTLGVIPSNFLSEYHVPPFEAAIRAGASSVMINSSNINGMPTALNRSIVNDLLKQKLAFKGFAVTDWQNVENIYNYDKVGQSYKDAIAIALNAGIDMFMVPYDYRTFQQHVTALVKEKRVSLSRINDAVTRIIAVKLSSGIFENSKAPVAREQDIYRPFHRELATQTALESITLLKNKDRLLPFKKNTRVLITGPNANSMRTINGGWTYSWTGWNADEYASSHNTILEALQEKMGNDNIYFEQGVVYKNKEAYYEDSVINLQAIKTKAASADVILVCVGENSYAETSGNLDQNLNLSANQTALIEAAEATGKPVIIVLNQGRPRVISQQILEQAHSILNVYLPGNFGADALADILTGDANPSGKLPFSYPGDPDFIAPYYHKYSQESRGDNGQYYRDRDFYPAFCFGEGLSYTSFSYKNLAINKPIFLPGDTAVISVDLKNTGDIRGKEAVLCFIADLRGNTLSPDVKRLRAFEKIELEAGLSRKVVFKIPINELSFYNYDNERVLEAGDFEIQVGDLSARFSVNRNFLFK